MAKNNPFTEFFSKNDFAKAFEQYQNLPFDMNSLLETQRKNIQALTEAQQHAMEGIQAIAQRQAQIVSQIVQDNSAIAKELMGEGTPEEKFSKNADMFKRIYERTIANLEELSEMVSKANNETGKIISKRVSASMNEIKGSVAEKKQQKKAA
ncbi:MAG TPA: hypothetical protein DEA55_09395 [Rhodospirillaceae bacterium]|nr:hypothetical protein [Rhodospirillaceae bacterium]